MRKTFCVMAISLLISMFLFTGSVVEAQLPKSAQGIILAMATKCCGYCYFGSKRGEDLDDLLTELLKNVGSEYGQDEMCKNACKLGYKSYQAGKTEKEVTAMIVAAFLEANKN